MYPRFTVLFPKSDTHKALDAKEEQELTNKDTFDSGVDPSTTQAATKRKYFDIRFRKPKSVNQQ